VSVLDWLLSASMLVSRMTALVSVLDWGVFASAVLVSELPSLDWSVAILVSALSVLTAESESSSLLLLSSLMLLLSVLDSMISFLAWNWSTVVSRLGLLTSAVLWALPVSAFLSFRPKKK
jgi:hypothetical protein